MYKNILLMLSLVVSFVVVSLFVAPVFAAEELAGAKGGDNGVIAQEKAALVISDAWARKSMSPNNNSAAYMKISNATDRQITIIGASAAMVANNVELHESFVDEQGISRMTSIDRIVVPANSEIELRPGGIHIMLLDLKSNLSSGDKFNLEIEVENMDLISVEATVR